MEGTGSERVHSARMVPTERESISLTCSARGTYQMYHGETFGLPLGAALVSGVQPEAIEVAGRGRRLGRKTEGPRGTATSPGLGLRCPGNRAPFARGFPAGRASGES